MRFYEIQENWWIPDYENTTYDLELELYELREWWCRPRQVTKQLDLPLDAPRQPRNPNPF
mgnify:CR=1 FL=1